MSIPLGLSENEKRLFNDKIRSPIRVKVISFITTWFKKYKDILFLVREMHILFQEIIYLLYCYTEKDVHYLTYLKQMLSVLQLKSTKQLQKGIEEQEKKILTKHELLNSFSK